MARSRVGRETRARILEATRELLATIGLEATTLKAICDRAGVGAGSFYNLFDSKEDVVLSVVRSAISAFDTDRTHDAETVQDLVQAYLAFVTREPALTRIYLQAAVSWGLADPSFAARFRRHQTNRLDRLRAAIARAEPALESDEVRGRAELLLATLNGLAMSAALDPDSDVAVLSERLLRDAVRM